MISVFFGNMVHYCLIYLRAPGVTGANYVSTRFHLHPFEKNLLLMSATEIAHKAWMFYNICHSIQAWQNTYFLKWRLLCESTCYASRLVMQVELLLYNWKLMWLFDMVVFFFVITLNSNMSCVYILNRKREHVAQYAFTYKNNLAMKQK